MNFEAQLNFHDELFALISVADKNENEAISFMNSIQDIDKLKEIVNTPNKCKTGNETMLMWAIWRLKKDVVNELLLHGADPLFVNHDEESASTYWNGTLLDDLENQKIACDIACILHKHGVDLSKNSYMSYSIVKRANKYDFVELKKILSNLGY